MSGYIDKEDNSVMWYQHVAACLVAVFCMTVLPLAAQRNELDQAETYIKSGKDYDKAEKLMTDLLKNQKNRENKKIYQMWLEAVGGQYAAANEKLYLKQKYDTSAFFGLTRRMFMIAETLDSLDMKPDKKGRVKPEYRKRHAERLAPLRPNLYYGGSYYIRKADFQTAYDFYDTYLDTGRQPLFSSYHYLENDSVMPQAAYWAVYCGQRMHDAQRVLKYGELAKRNVDKVHFALQYLCEAHLWKNDTVAYVNTLREGFYRCPEYSYFFPRLADYYTKLGENDSVMVVADYGLGVNPDNTLFLLAKSIVLLNTERYDECIDVSSHMIEICDTLPEPYYHIATCKLNQALRLEKINEPRKYRSKLQQLYKEARPYMEDYRRMVPDDKQRWGPALYRIYFNLNLGRQFEEIDKLLRNH